MSDTWDSDFWGKHEQYPVATRDGIRGIEKEGNFVSAPSQALIEQTLSTLIPEKELPLTPFSAKKKDGKKLYELARSGQIVTEFRHMKTVSTTVISYDFPLLTLRLEVGSGTYIRSIGYRLGQSFGLGGILTQLRRITVGQFDLAMLKLEALGDSGLLGAEIIPIDSK